jgi:patatin-like phospholipase/acyl hydrolase
MVEKWGPDFPCNTLISGGSAGTIFAVGLALGKSPQYMSDLYRKVSQNCHTFGTIYKCSQFMEEGLRDMLSDPLSYKKLEGKCCFGTTSFFSRHRWHVSWDDNEDLIDCIKASFHIPFYCKRISSLRDIEVLDGAYGFAGSDLPHGGTANKKLF